MLLHETLTSLYEVHLNVLFSVGSNQEEEFCCESGEKEFVWQGEHREGIWNKCSLCIQNLQENNLIKYDDTKIKSFCNFKKNYPGLRELRLKWF